MSDLGMKIYIRTAGVDEAIVSLDKLGNSASKLESKAKSLGYFFDQQGKLRHSNGKFAKSNDEVANSLRKMKEDADKAARATDGLSNSVNRSSTIMGGFTKLAMGFFSFELIRGAIDTADAFGQMSARIKLTIEDMREYDYVQNRLIESSKKAQRPLYEAQNFFIDTSGNLRDMGYSLREAIDISDSFTYALVRNATSALRAESALRAYDTALNTKTLDRNMWRSISSAIPSLEVDMSRLFDLPLAKIQELGYAGKITVDMLNKAFIESLSENERAAESMGSTFAGSIGVMKDKISSIIGDFNSFTGITAALSGGVLFLSDHLEYLLAPAIGIASAAVVTGLSLATIAVKAFTAAIMANPIGLLVVGTTTALTALYQLRHSIKLTADGSITLGDVVGGVWDALTDGIKSTYTYIKSFTTSIWNFLSKQVEGFGIELGDVMSFASKVVKAPFNIFINSALFSFDMVTKIFGALPVFMSNLGKSIAYAFTKPFELAINAIIRGINYLTELASWAVPDNWQNIGQVDFSSPFEGAGTDLKNQLVEGFSDAIGEMKKIYTRDVLGEIFAGTLGDTSLYEYIKKRSEDRKAEGRNKLSFDGGGAGGGGLGSYGGTGGLDLVNAYTKKLSGLSDETAKLISLNQQLLTAGYESQYNAVSSLTHELESQTSVLARLSGAQKHILLLKAGELDAQKQINAILNLSFDYGQKLDDMAFELELMGRSAHQIEAMKFARELEMDAKKLSIGMSEANILLLNEEIQKQLELFGVIQQNKIERENSIGGGIEAGFQQYIDSVGNMRDSFADATQAVFGHMEGFLVDFAHTGKLNFRDMTTSILQDISKMMIQMAMMQAVTGMQGWFKGLGWFSSGGSVPTQAWSGGLIPEYATGGRVVDFSGGGFTGMGGMFEPKGIVHGGEYVMSKAAVNVLGIGYLEQLHNLGKRGVPGFSAGGLVSTREIINPVMNHNMPVPASSNQAGNSGSEPDFIFHNDIKVQVESEGESGREIAMSLMPVFKKEMKRMIVDEYRPGGSLYRR